MQLRTTSNAKDICSVTVYSTYILHNVTGTKALRNFRTHGANLLPSCIFCSPGTVKMKFLSLKRTEVGYSNSNSLLSRGGNFKDRTLYNNYIKFIQLKAPASRKG